MLLPFIQLHPSDLRKSRLRHVCGGGGFPPTFVQVHNEHSGPAGRTYKQLTKRVLWNWRRRGRSARSFEFPNNLNESKRPIGEIREKAGVQVQTRYKGHHVPRSTKRSENYITQEVRGSASCGRIASLGDTASRIEDHERHLNTSALTRRKNTLTCGDNALTTSDVTPFPETRGSRNLGSGARRATPDPGSSYGC